MNREEITLTIPGKPKYISTVRLTTSSIANKICLDIDCIEDLRVAISEACNIAIDEKGIKINYIVDENSIEIKVTVPEGKINYKSDQSLNMGKQILSTLMDEVDFTEDFILLRKFARE